MDVRTIPVLPDWRSAELPDTIELAQTMLMKTEQQLLFSIMRDHFLNFGYVVDAGCFLGGSTLAIARGLQANPLWRANRKPGIIHSYDLFTVEPWTIGIYFPEGTPLDMSFEPVYRKNISAVSHLVEVHPGDITKAGPSPFPIELLFIDCAKHWTVNDYIVREFFPNLVPGHSIVIQQDYLYPTHTGWLPVTMEHFSDYFEIVDHTELNSVAFLNTKRIPDEMLSKDVFQSLRQAEMVDLANAALKRFPERKQQEVIEQSRDHLQEWLTSENWDATRDSVGDQ